MTVHRVPFRDARLPARRAPTAFARTVALGLALAAACGAAHAADPTPQDTVLDLVPLITGPKRPEGLQIPAGAQPLYVNLDYELTLNPRRNLDLDAGEPDRRSRIDQELKIGAYKRLGPRSSVLLSQKILAERDWQREGGTPTSDYYFERDEMWYQLERLWDQPVTMQIGRVPVSEERTWWWDDTLDALRLTWRGDTAFLDTGLGRELLRISTLEDRIDPAQRGVWRWFGHAGLVWRPRHALELFWLHANDRSGTQPIGLEVAEDAADASDARLTWFGLRAAGEERQPSGMRLSYWADLAWVTGSERLSRFDDAGNGVANQGNTIRKVSGQGLDFGASWTLPGALAATLTAAHARGSGDSNPDAGDDHAFRQTGLQENKVRFRGVTRFRRYGEVFRPELTNLSVSTLGVGARPMPEASVDLVWHRYFLAKAGGGLPASRLDRDPDGTSRRLGTEVDLILGWRVTPRADVALRYGVFTAGRAFGSGQGEKARNLETTLNLEF